MQFLCNFLVWVAREQMNSLCLHGTLSSYFPRAEKDLVFSSTSTILPRTPEWAGMTSLVLSSLSVYVSLTAWPEIHVSPWVPACLESYERHTDPRIHTPDFSLCHSGTLDLGQ